MTSHLKRVTCPTCHTSYQIRLDQKGVQGDEGYQLACHACHTVWTPIAEIKKPSQTHPMPPIAPATPKIETEPKVNVTPPKPQVPIMPPPAQPVYTPQPQQQPFIPVPQLPSSPSKSSGSTIGLIILATCIMMGGIVAILRNKEGNLLSQPSATRQPTISAPTLPTKSEELTIRDVRFDVHQTGQRQTILVVGMIDNITNRTFTLHPLQVSVWGPANQEGVSPTALKDKNGDCLLISWQHPFDVLNLDIGQSRPFQTVGSIPANLKISRVDVTLP